MTVINLSQLYIKLLNTEANILVPNILVPNIPVPNGVKSFQGHSFSFPLRISQNCEYLNFTRIFPPQ